MKQTQRHENERKSLLRTAALTALTAAVCTALLPLCGCLNPVSLDNYGYVVTVGADIGQKEKYEVILELQRESSNASDENEGGAIVLSVEAENLFDAINKISYGVPYELSFTRTHVFVFGEELARKGMIPDFLGLSFDTLRIRTSAMVQVTHCSVREYLGGLSANNNANLSTLQDDMINDARKTGRVAVINAARCFEACGGGRFDPVLPMGFYDPKVVTDTKQKNTATEGENPLADAEKGARLGGMQGLTMCAALFDGWVMKGWLDADDTQFMNIGKGDFESGTIMYDYGEPDGAECAALIAKLEKKRISVNVNGAPSAKAEYEISLTVGQDKSGRIGREWRSGMQQKLERYFETELARVFKLCRDCGCDAMGFGRYASKQFGSVESWENLNWKSIYPELDAEFIVKLTLDDEYIAETRQ